MWTFETVSRLKLGAGVLQSIGAEVRSLGDKAAVVCGRHLVANGTAATVQELLAAQGVQAYIVPGPPGEPTLTGAAACLAQARESGCTVVVGLGGGSVLDVAKAVAGLYHSPQAPLDAVTTSLYEGPRPDTPALPWVAVPTTAGTGSEVTHVVVLSDPERGIKQSMRHSAWYARAVLMDPALYATAPPHVTAAAGMDALTQAIEAHVSRGATVLTQALSRQAAALLGRNLVRAFRDGSDLTAREGTALGSCLAGMALTNARLGVVHGLAHPIGIRYRVSHGLACAVLLPHSIRYNMPVAEGGYRDLAVAIGLAGDGPLAAQKLLAFVEEINRRMGIPSSLRTLGVQAEDIPALARDAMPSGSTKANPRPVGISDLTDILHAAL